MEWSEAVYNALQLFREEAPLEALQLETILPYWDVTNLNEAATETDIQATLNKTQINGVCAAAICVYPRFVPFVKRLLLDAPLRVATVVNFPNGNASLQAVGLQIEQTIADGADEIDVVFPYHAFLQHEYDFCSEFVSYCKSLCGDSLLKVILETGMLSDPALIVQAATLSALAGADFIKTSTGKVSVGATLDSVAAILLAIDAVKKDCAQTVGLKVSGGIKTVQEATKYYRLAALLMGEAWMVSRHFRVGASVLA